jgi:hypothetical protein
MCVAQPVKQDILITHHLPHALCIPGEKTGSVNGNKKCNHLIKHHI